MHMENRLFPPAKLPRYPQRGVSVPVHIARARHLQAHSSRCKNCPGLHSRAVPLPPAPAPAPPTLRLSCEDAGWFT